MSIKKGSEAFEFWRLLQTFTNISESKQIYIEIKLQYPYKAFVRIDLIKSIRHYGSAYFYINF